MNSAILIKEVDDYYSILKNHYGFNHVKYGGFDKLVVPGELGSGYISSISPCEDIEISVMHLNLSRPLVMFYEDFDCMFEATYCFCGGINCTETGVVDTSLRQSDLGIYIKSHSRGMMMFPPGEEILVVSLLAKNNFYNQLPFKDDCTHCCNSTYRNLVNTLLVPRKTSVHIHNLFSQIVGNRLDEELQPAFLEGASKMLLSSLWQSNVVNPLKGKNIYTCSDADQKAIREAEYILNCQYMSPPTISELSKMTALNEYKLKTGFREIFGKTIYEYVREQRMWNAKNLLEDDNLSISQIAYMVGYINTSHFARAFKKEYGLNPSDLRCGAKKIPIGAELNRAVC